MYNPKHEKTWSYIKILSKNTFCSRCVQKVWIESRFTGESAIEAIHKRWGNNEAAKAEVAETPLGAPLCLELELEL